MNRRLLAAVTIISFGGFIFGYDLGALSTATLGLRSQFNLSPGMFGLTVSSSVWGTVFGSILAGCVADKIGRRRLIAGCAMIYAIAAIGITLPVPSDWVLVLAMRVLCGVAIGGLTVGCPLYLAELAPSAMRGRIVGLFQIQVGLGVIIAFSIGALLAHFAIVSAAWKWSLGLGAIPAAVLAIAMQFVGTGLGSEVESPRVNLNGQLFRRTNTRSILVATSIAMFNQLSGVNILLLYMLDILATAGINFHIGHTYTVVVSVLGLITGLLGMAFVDRLGRKPLLYMGSAGMAVCLFGLGLAIPRHLAPLLYLGILIAYNAFFAFSQGTVVWTYLSELFPPGLRGLGQGYGTSVHWIANAMLVSVFPSVQRGSSVRIFYIFAFMMVVQIVVIWIWYPETRGTDLGTFNAAVRVEGDRSPQTGNQIGW